MNIFWADHVEKKNAQNPESFTLALAVAEGLMEKQLTQTFKTMINFKHPPRSKILDSLMKEFKAEAKAEAKAEVKAEARKEFYGEVKAEVQEELVMRYLKMGMSPEHITEITGL